MKNIAIIPARGGSKRVPHKNIIDFCGKPMLAWTIEAAQQSELFTKIIVSTDDEGIAKVAKTYGAEVPFLREDFADDHSPVSLATALCLEKSQNYYNEKFDNIVQLFAVCPLRDHAEITNAYNNFIHKNAKFQISVFRFGWINPWWALKINADDTFEAKFLKEKNQRSQDAEELYCPTGAIWIAKAEELLKTRDFLYTENTIVHEIDWKSAIDIDNYEDLEMAEAIYLLKTKHKK